MTFKLLQITLSFYLIITQVNASKRPNNNIHHDDSNNNKNCVQEYLGNLKRRMVDNDEQEEQGQSSSNFSNPKGKTKKYEPGASSLNSAIDFDVHPFSSLDLNEPWSLSISYNRNPHYSFTPGESSKTDSPNTRDFLSRFAQESDEQVANDSVQTNAELDPKNHKFIRIEGKTTKRQHCTAHKTLCGRTCLVMTKCKDCDAFICAECQKETHGLESVPIPIDEDQTCFYCNESLGRDSETLVEHTSICPHIPHNIKKGRRTLYACYKNHDECDIQTSHRPQMKCHVQSHLRQKPFYCEPCGIPFGTKGSLDRHNKNKHK